ncbi:hypothetical protein D3C76_1027710 [compost metagenome]
MQHLLVIPADQRFTDPVCKRRMEQVQTFIVTNYNKAGIAAGCYLEHKFTNGFDILFFNLFAQGWNKRNLFRLYFGTHAHFLIKLSADVGIVISAQ